MKHHLLALGMVVVLALGGAVVGALAGRSSPTKSTVTVTVREYRISLSVKTLPAGPVLLVVHNAGHVAHALSVSGPGLATRTTPVIEPGATKTLRVMFGGGTFRVWCPVGGHAAAGMKASLTAHGPLVPIVTSTDSTTAGGGYGYGP